MSKAKQRYLRGAPLWPLIKFSHLSPPPPPIIFKVENCGNCLQTLQTVSQQMGNQITILGSIKHPTPAKNWFMLYFSPSALGAPASDDLSAFKKNENMLFCHSVKKNKDSLPFYNGYFTKTSFTRTTLQLRIHSLLRMLQYFMAREGT